MLSGPCPGPWRAHILLKSVGQADSGMYTCLAWAYSGTTAWPTGLVRHRLGDTGVAACLPPPIPWVGEVVTGKLVGTALPGLDGRQQASSEPQAPSPKLLKVFSEQTVVS